MQPLPPFMVLENPVQRYAWGSPTAIPRLLGRRNPAGEPWAELWMGTHPRAGSEVIREDRRVPLSGLIRELPGQILGPRVAARFHGRLPFLFKVLAAARPLSIQAHPNLEQAREGFAREEAAGVAIDAPHRNYRDANHKPETICALTRFRALRGFRKIDRILDLMRTARIRALGSELDALSARTDRRGVKRFFSALLTLPTERRKTVVRQAVEAASALSAEPAFEWVVRLHGEYPSDIGVLAPLLLNLVTLEPGQAMFLPAGELHAYLEGVGIELMAESDNVLRGGLTPKHVDVPELLRVLTFSGRDVEILEGKPAGPAEAVYPRRAEEFELSRVFPGRDAVYKAGADRHVEIMICVEGRATLRAVDRPVACEMPTGRAVLVPAAAGAYRIEGEAVLYRATVPRLKDGSV